MHTEISHLPGDCSRTRVRCAHRTETGIGIDRCACRIYLICKILFTPFSCPICAGCAKIHTPAEIISMRKV